MKDEPRQSVIEVSELTKVYPITGSATDPIRALFGLGSRKSPSGQVAIRGLNLSLEAGASLGLLGRNGSGKSTLLRILSGALKPTAGEVSVNGRVAALLDLGSGMGMDFTGRENAVLMSVLAGRTRQEALRYLNLIHEFSGLGAAFERPVRTYSSGMVLRLGFSAAVHCSPGILLIDEVLSVGDTFFQQRCLARIRELQAQGCTTVIVSHDPSAILSFCDRALWLERGEVVSEGNPAKVVREYLGARYEDQGALSSDLLVKGRPEVPDSRDEIDLADGIDNMDHRYGDGSAEIEGVCVRSDSGSTIHEVRVAQPLRVVITVRSNKRLSRPIVGFSLRNRLGDIVTATNTAHEGIDLPELQEGDRIDVEFSLRWPAMASGPMLVSPAIAEGTLDVHRMCDWVDNAVALNGINPRGLFGWMSLEDVQVRSCTRRATLPPGLRSVS